MDINSAAIFQKVYKDSLHRNNLDTINWTKYKTDLSTTESTLKWLPDKLSHAVLVPMGPKAFMRGKIVHTNELLVNIGEGYLTKCTAKQAGEICQRRISHAEEMLTKLDTERNLLENKQNWPIENEAFGSEARPEIIEYVTEEDDEAWRKEHRQKEKEYRERLKYIREKTTPIETEEDLWNRLDELELIEELEDELHRLGDKHSSEDDETDSQDDNLSLSIEDDSVIQNSSESIAQCESVSLDEHESEFMHKRPLSTSKASESNSESQSMCANQTKPMTPNIKRKVSFSIKDDSPSDTLILNFNHSSANPSHQITSNAIKTPADIYPNYITSIKSNGHVRSILKVKTNPNQSDEILKSSAQCIDDEEKDSSNAVFIHRGIEIPDIVERLGTAIENQVQRVEKISKFKASRMKR